MLYYKILGIVFIQDTTYITYEVGAIPLCVSYTGVSFYLEKENDDCMCICVV